MEKLTTNKLAEAILKNAQQVVTGERQENYGNAEDSFERIAGMWNAMGMTINGRKIGMADVALAMITLKIARFAGVPKIDNYVDICGYAALGGAIGLKEKSETASTQFTRHESEVWNMAEYKD